MNNTHTFRFSAEQLKKLNLILPKGFKFVTKEQASKRDHIKIPKKKASLAPPPVIFTQMLPPIVQQAPIPQPPPTILPKQKIVKEEDYKPESKKVVAAPIVVPVDQVPAGSNELILERLKRHPHYANLYHFKSPQDDLSLRTIEDNVKMGGQSYKLADFENDFKFFFLAVYQHSTKTSSDYRLASELEAYFTEVMKVEKGESKRPYDGRGGQGGRKKAPPVKTYLPLAAYKMATPSQKRQLGMMIRKLSSQDLQRIIYIMFESSEVKEYSFDLDNIHIKKFRQLEQFVKKCMEKITDWDPRTLEDEEFSNESEFIIDNDDS